MKALAATCLLVAALTWPAGSAFATDADEARLMLERMSAAMSQMTYQGTFVYVQGDEVETMRITHVSDEHGVRERLVALSGAPREMMRDSTGLRWVLADDNSVFQDPGFSLSFFPDLPADQRGLAEESYTLTLGPEARIAGQQSRNLRVVPRDKYRYGYSLWLEETSDLLLKWELLDTNQKTIAKLMFTDIRLGSEVDVKELKPGSYLKKYKTVESLLPSGRGTASPALSWQPGALPPGFRLTAHRYFGERAQGIYEHLVYSDGLAAVSVYIESITADSTPQTGMGRMGTTHAFSRTADNVLITVVGDVPANTVRFIADAVEMVTH